VVRADSGLARDVNVMVMDGNAARMGWICARIARRIVHVRVIRDRL
jgi:hypothetical protein